MTSLRKAPTAQDLPGAIHRRFNTVREHADARLTLAQAREIARPLSHTMSLYEAGRAPTDKLLGGASTQAVPGAAGAPISLLDARMLANAAPSLSAEQQAALGTMVLQALDDGSAVKLARAPFGLRGKTPVVPDIQHPSSGTHGAAFIAHGQVYLQRASHTSSPHVGWWRIGPAPF